MNRPSLPLMVSLAALVAACGNPKNESLPPSIGKLKAGKPTGTNKLWNDLASALGIGNNRAADTDALIAQLGTPSTALSAEALPALSNKLAAAYVGEAYKTRCAGVTSVTRMEKAQRVGASGLEDLATPNGASYYLMEFKLAADANGTPEEGSRYGYLTLPTAGAPNSVPFIAYAHAGMAGLSYYSDVAAMFGDLQLNHIIAAPAYPGEKVCKAGFNATQTDCDNAGEIQTDKNARNPFVGDSDVVLGMYDCLVRSLTEAGQIQADPTLAASQKYNPMLTANDPTSMLGAKLGAIYKRHGDNTEAKLPVSYIVGTDHGGLTAQLALAKTGAANATVAAGNAAALGAGYGPAPSTFTCAVSVGAPATAAHDKYRLALEQATQGVLKTSPMAPLPFVQVLDLLLAPYRANLVSAEAMALELQKRDAMFNAGLIAGGLMKWKSYLTTIATTKTLAPGSMLFVHGAQDALVFPTQTALASGTLEQVQAALRAKGTIGGVNVTALAVNLPEGISIDVSKGVFGHLADDAFRKGTTLTATKSAEVARFATTEAIRAGIDANLEAVFTAQGSKTPATAIYAWLTGSSGCNGGN